MKRFSTRIAASILCATAGFFTTGNAIAGDAAAGKAASVTCAACHGADGVSISDQFPNLAGQVPGYIAAQLAKYKSGARVDAVMAGMVAALSDDDMANLDAYYAGLEAPEGAVTPEQEADALAGGAIYRGGYAEFQIAACMSCHGPAGNGIPPLYPRVNGQHAAYLEAQLLKFKSGERVDPIMNPIAFPLSAAQIKELALYMSGLN